MMTYQELKRAIQVQKQGGASMDEARFVIEALVKSNGQLPIEQVMAEVELAYQVTKERTLSDKIADFITSSSRDFWAKDLDRECGIANEKDKATRRKVMERAVERGMVERDKKVTGLWHKVEDDCATIDVDNVDTKTLDVKLPFNLHNFLDIYPKNIIIVAGSSDAGKSAILIDMLYQNRDSVIPMRYYNSEMGAQELRRRFVKRDAARWWGNISLKERDYDFDQVVGKDAINIIDYLEITENHYLVAEVNKKITAKLKNGIAVIAMQKKKGADLGYGAEHGMWKPRLYMSVDWDKDTKTNSMVIQKAKNPKDGMPHIKGWKWIFRIHDGVHIEVLEEPPEMIEYAEDFDEAS